MASNSHRVIVLGMGLLLTSSTSLAQGPVNLTFSGVTQLIDEQLTNPYSGETVQYAGDGGQANINNSSYVGGPFIDSIDMTAASDALFIRNTSNQQVVTNIELFLPGAGNDLIHLADTVFSLNSSVVIGGSGDDILWTNAGNDEVIGEQGNDHLVGGPGIDALRGGSGDDYLGGGEGDDFSIGGSGSDLLAGGPGADVYYVTQKASTVPHQDVIRDSGADGLLNRLIVNTMIFSPAEISISALGNDLWVTASSAEFSIDLLVEGQFDSPTSGIEEIVFVTLPLQFTETGEELSIGGYQVPLTSSVLDLPMFAAVSSIDVRAMFVPEPSAFGLAFAALGLGAYIRRSR